MIARRVALFLGVTVAAFSGAYVFVYLYRWEWNRALFCLGLFVAVEVALGLGVVLSRLARLTGRVDELVKASNKPVAVDPVVLAHIQDAAPEPSRPFAWLAPEDGRTAVFVPVLMGAGIVLSALAWLVERIAAAGTRPVMERDLAARLTSLALPDTLVPSREDVSASLYHPGSCARAS